MVDATLTATALGVYEKPLTANTVYTVQLQGLGGAWGAPDRMYLLNHGTAAIYARFDATPTVGDPQAIQVTGGGHALIGPSAADSTAGTGQLSIISAGSGSFTITRQYDDNAVPAGGSTVSDNGDGTLTIN